MAFLLEIVDFLRARRKYWLVPIILVLLLFGGLIVLSQGSAVAPFIYTLFNWCVSSACLLFIRTAQRRCWWPVASLRRRRRNALRA